MFDLSLLAETLLSDARAHAQRKSAPEAHAVTPPRGNDPLEQAFMALQNFAVRGALV